MAAVEYYPIDFDSLTKGQIIPRERVEEIVGTKFEHRLYGLRAMALREQIEGELQVRGKPMVTRVGNGAIHILDDAEAAEYTAQQNKIAIRKLVRSHHKALRVDVAKLDGDQRQVHERNILAQGKYIQAIAAVRKQLKLEPHKRSTPGIETYRAVGAE